MAPPTPTQPAMCCSRSCPIPPVVACHAAANATGLNDDGWCAGLAACRWRAPTEGQPRLCDGTLNRRAVQRPLNSFVIPLPRAPDTNPRPRRRTDHAPSPAWFRIPDRVRRVSTRTHVASAFLMAAATPWEPMSDSEVKGRGPSIRNGPPCTSKWNPDRLRSPALRSAVSDVARRAGRPRAAALVGGATGGSRHRPNERQRRQGPQGLHSSTEQVATRERGHERPASVRNTPTARPMAGQGPQVWRKDTC